MIRQAFNNTAANPWTQTSMHIYVRMYVHLYNKSMDFFLTWQNGGWNFCKLGFAHKNAKLKSVWKFPTLRNQDSLLYSVHLKSQPFIPSKPPSYMSLIYFTLLIKWINLYALHTYLNQFFSRRGVFLLWTTVATVEPRSTVVCFRCTLHALPTTKCITIPLHNKNK